MKRAWWKYPAWLAVMACFTLGSAAEAAPAGVVGKIAGAKRLDTSTRFDVNNIDMFVTNSGGFARDLVSPGGPSGFFFPKGTDKTAVYAAGLWFGSKVNNDIRVTVAEYSFEYQPGYIYHEGGQVRWSDSASDSLRTFKVAKDDSSSSDYLTWKKFSEDHHLPFKPHAGDQTLWGVFNDANPTIHTNNAGSSNPQNLEVQQTTFGFDRQGALGNMVFIRWRFINKSVGDTLKDCYASFWSDPDLGGATDDMVGCDVSRSLGFVYNANNNDEIYGGSPPCVGYRFFEGPAVPGAPGDSALVNGVWRRGFKNLPMTSFNKYINGTDPKAKDQSYNYMQGLNADGTAMVDPTTGLPTTFVHSGDPVAGTGWLDPQQADKRLQLSSGPFTMAPGDTQEVVVGMIVGAGKDRLQSITIMKLYADKALDAFKQNFILGSPPVRPSFYALAGDKSIDLVWGPEALGTENSTPLRRFVFQGYNLYQGESIAGPWHKIATWDIADSVGIIYDDVFEPAAGGLQRVVAQLGTNSGLTQHVRLTQDAIRGGPLINNFPYFYALTAYSYDVRNMQKVMVGPQAGWLTENLENSQAGVEVSPKASAAVETIKADHSGNSDGSVEVLVLTPEATVPGQYQVAFHTDPADSTRLLWNLTRQDTPPTTLLTNQRYQSDPGIYLYPILDGMMVRVLGPAPGPKRTTEDYPMIDEIKGPGGVDVPADARGGPGKAIWHHRNSTGEWFASAGGGDGGEARFSSGGSDYLNMDARDIIIKFDNAADNVAWWYYDTGDSTGWASVPFGVYLRDPITGAEERLVPLMFSGGGTGSTVGVFDIATDSELDPYTSYPASDRIYVQTFQGSWAALVADVADGALNDPVMLSYEYNTAKELCRRLFFASDKTPPVLPASGTVIKITTAKPVTTSDIFSFRIVPAGETPGTIVGYDLSRIRAVPNPYFNQSQYELNQFNRVIKFTNLPNKPTTIRIFDLAGELVRTLDKPDPNSAELNWDLQNERQIPVASGIYLFHVDVKGVGTKFGKLAVFVEKERLNRY